MNNLISFIVPIYNSQNYLEKCLTSLVMQGPFTEIVLVNDGSTDGTHEICQKYKEKYNNVIYINCEKNGGVSHARNVGIQNATGEFLVFVDADDALDSLSEISGVISKKYDLVIFGRKTIKPNLLEECTLPFYGYIEKQNLIENHLDVFLNVSTVTWTTNKIYKSSIIKNNCLEFDEGVSFAEDLFFNIKYFEFCNSIYFCDKYLSYYNRTIENSLSRQFEKQNISKIIDSRKKVFEFLKRQKNINYNVLYKDTKNILMYGVSKIINHKSLTKEEKIKELNYLKTVQPEVVECFNENDSLEALVKKYITENDLKILE